MIPKKIHYCWFGGNPLSSLARKCIASWRKYCPDYEIIEWNEDNFDIFSAPLYVQQAYEAKKWAFIADYVRLYVMTRYGGIYMDTDVELVKPIDQFLKHPAFAGFEDPQHISTAIMACEEEFPLFLELLQYYDDAQFFLEDGTLNTTTNVKIITRICNEHGFVPNNQYQILDGFVLYPNDVFCPVDYATNVLRKSKNTVAIHWFAGSWHSEQQRRQMKESQKRKRHWKLKNDIIHIPTRVARVILGEEFYEKIRSKLKRKH